MNHNLYKAAAKGEIEPFNEIEKDQLGSVVTRNLNTVLHVNIGESVSAKFVEQILEMCPSLLVQVNAKGDAPLHVAAKCGNDAVVKVLIEFAKKQPIELESSVDTLRQMLGMTNEEQNTALHEAVLQRQRSLNVVKMLIEADPDVPYSTNGRGETPLYIAAANGSVQIVAEILDKCTSAAHEGPDGKTALHAAVYCYPIGVMEKLIEKKSRLTIVQDQHGWTPLHHAAYSGREFISKLLLESDKSAAYICDKDRKMTPLLLAAGRGHIRLVEEIISSCPDCCDLVDDRGWNLLHFAVLSLNFVQLLNLLKNYLSVITIINNKDVNGNTPLHVLAALCRLLSYEVVPPILGGNYEACNNHDISVRHVIRHGFPELEQEIQELSKDIGQGQYSDGVVKVRKEKWPIEGDFMNETKQRQTLVATLIATVTFAAAFTLPGGYWGKEGPIPGTAILRKNAAFQAFVISDAIAMVLSLSTVFIHFLFAIKTLRNSMLFFNLAHIFTMVSMFAMVVAFVAGTYAALAPSSGLAIATCCLGLSFLFFALLTTYKFFSILEEMNVGEL